MVTSLPFLFPFIIFGVLILVALGLFIKIPDYIASFLHRSSGPGTHLTLRAGDVI